MRKNMSDIKSHKLHCIEDLLQLNKKIISIHIFAILYYFLKTNSSTV